MQQAGEENPPQTNDKLLALCYAFMAYLCGMSKQECHQLFGFVTGDSPEPGVISYVLQWPECASLTALALIS